MVLSANINFIFVFLRKSCPKMISYRHVGLPKSLASTPSTVLPFTNSRREISDKFTDSDVSSKLPLIVVVILFVFDMFGFAPGGKHLSCTMVPVLPVSNRHIRGRSNRIPPMYLILTIQTGAISCCRVYFINLLLFDVGMNIISLISLIILSSSSSV